MSATRIGLTGVGFAVALIAALTSCGVAPDDPSAPPPSRPTITVTGTGEVAVVPDVKLAVVVVDFTAPDVSAAMAQTSARQAAVVDALVAAGVDRRDVAAGGLDVLPTDAGGPPGYRAVDTLTLTVRRPDQTPRLLDLAVRVGGGAARVESVADGVADTSAVVDEARRRAYQDALEQAQRAAAVSGKRLGARNISTHAADNADESVKAYAQPTGAMPGQLTLRPGQRTVRTRVTTSWELV